MATGHAVRQTVLVVEADPDDLVQTVSLLRSAGYNTITAPSFEQGSAMLRTTHPDLIVTGLRLGAYNGLHLVLRGRMTQPEVPAIVTTRHPDPVLAQETEQMKAVYLLRPLDTQGFLSRVSQLLQDTARELLPRSAFSPKSGPAPS
jgi:DNA-binding NtrC family response regulator